MPTSSGKRLGCNATPKPEVLAHRYLGEILQDMVEVPKTSVKLNHPITHPLATFCAVPVLNRIAGILGRRSS